MFSINKRVVEYFEFQFEFLSANFGNKSSTESSFLFQSASSTWKKVNHAPSEEKEMSAPVCTRVELGNSSTPPLSLIQNNKFLQNNLTYRFITVENQSFTQMPACYSSDSSWESEESCMTVATYSC